MTAIAFGRLAPQTSYAQFTPYDTTKRVANTQGVVGNQIFSVTGIQQPLMGMPFTATFTPIGTFYGEKDDKRGLDQANSLEPRGQYILGASSGITVSLFRYSDNGHGVEMLRAVPVQVNEDPRTGPATQGFQIGRKTFHSTAYGEWTGGRSAPNPFEEALINDAVELERRLTAEHRPPQLTPVR